MTNAAYGGQANTSPSLTIKIADLFRKINPSDKEFIKYIPKKFFVHGVAEDESRIESRINEAMTMVQKMTEQKKLTRERVQTVRERSEAKAKASRELDALIKKAELSIARDEKLNGSFAKDDTSASDSNVISSQSTGVVNDGTSEVKPLFSRKGGYWRTGFSKNLAKKLEIWVKNDIKSSENSLSDTANWMFNRFDGIPVFAIYSTEDTQDPTVLYAAKGVQAELERECLADIMEEFNYERANEKSEIADEVFSVDWVRGSGSSFNGASALGRRSDIGDAGLLRKQPKRKPSAAFRSVIENIIQVGKRGGRGGRGRIVFSQKLLSQNNADGINEAMTMSQKLIEQDEKNGEPDVYNVSSDEDVQGLTGTRKSYSSMPYSKVQFFSIQTPSISEIFVPDCELFLMFSNGFTAKFEFKGNTDITQIGRMISEYVLES